MKNIKRQLSALLLVLTVIGLSNIANSQYIEDALRYMTPSWNYSARSGALGVAFNGVSDDLSALMYNPAGLSLIPKNEFSIGMGYTHNSTETNFIGNLNTMGSNNAYLTQGGIVAPFKAGERNAAFALGYFLETNYSNNYEYSGFNTVNTMTDYFASHGNKNKDYNIAYYLWLTDDNLFTPIKDSLQQSAYVSETGGLHNITGGTAFDLSDNVSIGLTLTGKFGNYRYNRLFHETDTRNIYNFQDSLFANVDFDYLRLEEDIRQSVSGLSGSVAIMARFLNSFRLGITVKLPTYYNVEEDYDFNANAFFDNGGTIDTPYIETARISYSITTPFIYSIGMSFHEGGLTLSGGFEYTDAAQASFDDPNDDERSPNDNLGQTLNTLNREILHSLTGLITWGLGAEFEIPLTSVILRAGYQNTSTPYIKDVIGSSITQYSFGAGIFIAPNARIDMLFNMNKQTQQRANYYASEDYNSLYTYRISPMSISLGLTYRY